MFEGKEHRRQLIEELRTTHTLQAPEQKIKKQETEQIDEKKLQEKRLLHKVRSTITYSGIEHVSVATVAITVASIPSLCKHDAL